MSAAYGAARQGSSRQRCGWKTSRPRRPQLVPGSTRANGLMRVLFDPLFDLLKGKTDTTGFTGVRRHRRGRHFQDARSAMATSAGVNWRSCIC